MMFIAITNIILVCCSLFDDTDNEIKRSGMIGMGGSLPLTPVQAAANAYAASAGVV